MTDAIYQKQGGKKIHTSTPYTCTIWLESRRLDTSPGMTKVPPLHNISVIIDQVPPPQRRDTHTILTVTPILATFTLVHVSLGFLTWRTLMWQHAPTLTHQDSDSTQ